MVDILNISKDKIYYQHIDIVSLLMLVECRTENQ